MAINVLLKLNSLLKKINCKANMMKEKYKMISSNDDGIIILPIDKEKFSIDDGRFIIDQSLLPVVCSKCGRDGIRKQLLRIKAPYDWKFWLPIGALLGGPLLFGLGSALAYFFFGNEGLSEYSAFGISIATLISVFGGFRMATSNRENWFLTFYFCQDCSGQYKKLTFISRLFLWGSIILLLVMITIAIVGPALQLKQETLQLLMWVFLLGAISMFAISITYYIKKRISQGLVVRWITGDLSLSIKFKNSGVARIMKTKLQME